MRVFRGLSQASPHQTVLTIGNFDGVHLGHRALLARLGVLAQANGGVPTVLTFEPHPREFFAPESAPRRLSTLREKIELLAADGVAQTFVCRFNQTFASLSAEAFIHEVLIDRLRVRHLIVGDDFRFGARRVGDFALLQTAGKARGFEVEAMASVLAKEGEGEGEGESAGLRVSSSAVREALWEGELERAARLLGRPYVIDGRVVHGEKLGRQLGYATANIRMKHERPPLLGVFAVEVAGLGEKPLPGVANLGFRPTANAVPRPLLEVHLFDFSAEIYGAHLSVRFLKKIRSEMKFSGIDALKAQIAHDADTARQFFRL